jgi:hypothetical protein
MKGESVMAVVGVLIKVVVVMLAVATVGIFIVVIVATVMTTVAVHTEEWQRTLKRPAPGRLPQIVRRILGVYVRRMDSDLDESIRPEEEPPWYERSGGPTRW